MICDPGDRKIFRDVMKALRGEAKAGKDLQELVLAAGRYFLDAPYAASPLEHEPETLVVNLRGFDCFTFVENAVVLAGLALKGRAGFATYAAALRAVRYRNGLIDGYPSRLHYFTDWVYENSRRGILKDITPTVGARSFRKKISHMTMHREQYPALRDEAHFQRLKDTEKSISRRIRYEISREQLQSVESRIAAGDLIAILTDQKGLDCLHAGLAIHSSGHLHLLHASQKAGAVIISPETLSAYLAADLHRSGILIARASGTQSMPERAGRNFSSEK